MNDEYRIKYNIKKLPDKPFVDKIIKCFKEKEYEKYYNADVLIISMVDLTRIDNPNREVYKFDNELFTINEIIELKNKYNIKRVICTHIDCEWGNTYEVLKSYEEKLEGIEFAYDGMKIDLSEG